MTIEADHVIHSKNGLLGAGVSSAEDVRRICARALDNTPQGGLLLHFHGGLVSRADGLSIANRLVDRYQKAGAYPIFFVWQSGLLEAIRNNLGDIVRDPVFKELLKKAAEWLLKESPGAVATRGTGQAVDAQRLREDFDAWFAGTTGAPPLPLAAPGGQITTRGTVPDEDDLATRIEAEIETDPAFEQTMAGLAVASGRVPAATTRSANIVPRPVPVHVDQRALDQLFPPAPPVAVRGGIPWLMVAKFVAKVVIASVKRFVRKRDHGPYVTLVEEVLRAAYLAKLGELIWNQMKKDTADAFQAGPGAGTVLLEALAAAKAGGANLPRFTLVGHSTGAIYINNFIANAVRRLPGFTCNVIFLAPACRCDALAETLEKHGAAIANFRLFAMRDALEQADQLVPVIYPRSLLYLVSGVLEGEADVPLAGMERFIANENVFDAGAFAAVATVRKYLGPNNRAVWADADGTAGLCSRSHRHGDFDDDVPTLDSISAILKTGY